MESFVFRSDLLTGHEPASRWERRHACRRIACGLPRRQGCRRSQVHGKGTPPNLGLLHMDTVEGRGTKDEGRGRRTRDGGRGTKDEGRRTRDEGRGTKDEGRGTKDEDEGRRT